MCGRFVQTNLETPLREIVDPQSIFAELNDSYNVSPGQLAPLLLTGPSGKREVRALKWGFLPHWAAQVEKGVRPQINARAEGLEQKPCYREAFKNRRCLIPASGFFEWKDKQPYYICSRSRELLFFAGLWDNIQSAALGCQQTFAIITTAANERISSLHDRMPAIISPNHIEDWLHAPAKQALSLLHPTAMDLDFFPVSHEVNSPTNNALHLITPLSVVSNPSDSQAN